MNELPAKARLGAGGEKNFPAPSTAFFAVKKFARKTCLTFSFSLAQYAKCCVAELQRSTPLSLVVDRYVLDNGSLLVFREQSSNVWLVRRERAPARAVR